jgi:hypothetical protein
MGKTLTVNSLTAYTVEPHHLLLALQPAVGFGLSNNTTLQNYDDIFHGIPMNRFGDRIWWRTGGLTDRQIKGMITVFRAKNGRLYLKTAI